MTSFETYNDIYGNEIIRTRFSERGIYNGCRSVWDKSGMAQPIHHFTSISPKSIYTEILKPLIEKLLFGMNCLKDKGPAFWY